MTWELAIAEIDDEILLGDDTLRRDHEGPMDILNSRNVILFKGQEIPLQTVGFPKWALEVSVLEDEIIPGMMEKIVDVFVDRPDQAYSEKIEENMLVEENPEFHDKYGCCVAPVND